LFSSNDILLIQKLNTKYGDNIHIYKTNAQISLGCSMRKAVIVLSSMIFFGTAAAATNTTRGDLAFAGGDYAAALEDWQLLANANNASAMLGIGVLYDTGHGVTQNFATALSWYRRAAEAGSAGGAFNVAVMYDSGRGTPIDRAQAVTWYKRAAAKGYGRAAYNLGLIYRDGDGVPRNRDLAIRFFQEAARENIPAARANLASLGVTAVPKIAPQRPAGLPAPPALAPSNPAGRNPSQPPLSPQTQEDLVTIGQFEQQVLARTNLPPDVARTFQSYLPTFMKQSLSGDHLAQYNLAFAYQRGIGLPVDYVLAYVYYVQASAAAQTNVRTAAVQGAVDVASVMTDEQHDVARDTLLGVGN
jgi:TPR repeat protein